MTAKDQPQQQGSTNRKIRTYSWKRGSRAPKDESNRVIKSKAARGGENSTETDSDAAAAIHSVKKWRSAVCLECVFLLLFLLFLLFCVVVWSSKVRVQTPTIDNTSVGRKKVILSRFWARNDRRKSSRHPLRPSTAPAPISVVRKKLNSGKQNTLILILGGPRDVPTAHHAREKKGEEEEEREKRREEKRREEKRREEKRREEKRREEKRREEKRREEKRREEKRREEKRREEKRREEKRREEKRREEKRREEKRREEKRREEKRREEKRREEKRREEKEEKRREECCS